MEQFLSENFLLTTETARRLYRDYAKDLPLVDYHCHISPQEIYEDRRFPSLAQVWLGNDHYKWRLMRTGGVPEEYISGDAPDEERIVKFAEVLELAVGNPMYHWCHMELKEFFGYDKPLTPENAREVSNFCGEKLRSDPELTARGMIRKSNVKFIGTTDDPVDSLIWHEKLKNDPTAPCLVCPSFRPDNAINLIKPGFADYISRLAQSVGRESLPTVEDVCAALVKRLEFFKEMGCRASDHGMEYVPFRPCTAEEANAAYQKALSGKPLTQAEAEGYQTTVLLHLARVYHRMGIVMQIHYSCMRNVNTRMFREVGPDMGFDTIGQNSCGAAIAGFLNALEETQECPKIILYSLNSGDNEFLDALTASFQSGSLPGKIQHGAAWWFNDTKSGIEAQMRSYANLGILGNFIGMLTDSRSFLSYTRHDYFRRILCDMLGKWVENGEYPDSDASLKKIVEGICCKNALRYFDI